MEQKFHELAQQYQHTIQQLASQHVSQIKSLRWKFLSGWDPQYCHRRSSLLHCTTSPLLTEETSLQLAGDPDVARQQASLVVPQNKPVVSVGDLEEQFMHELSLLVLEQESRYESLRIQQLKELLTIQQTLLKVKSRWSHVVWEGTLDKMKQGECIGKLQFLGPSAMVLDTIPTTLVMSRRVELSDLEEVLESSQVLFFITQLLSRDEKTTSLFNREVKKVHDRRKAGRVGIAGHKYIYFIPLTKVTLVSPEESGPTELLEDARGKFLVVVPALCNLPSQNFPRNKWKIDLEKMWPYSESNVY